MTASTVPYYHWNSRSDSQVDPYNACSPNLVSLQDYYRRRWGAVSLGCHNQRPVTGGSSLSSHAWGAACDPQFPNRTITVEAMAWTISVSAELGINTIHDYIRQQMWKPNEGWVPASIGSVGGQWIHVETTPAAFGDGRPVEDKLTGSELDVPLTGGDAQLVAAVVWETMIDDGHGNKKTAREWLTIAADVARIWTYLLPAAEGLGQDTAESRVNYSAIKTFNTVLPALDAIQKQLLALQVPGGDVDAVRAIVEGVVNDTVLTVRPPS